MPTVAQVTIDSNGMAKFDLPEANTGRCFKSVIIQNVAAHTVSVGFLEGGQVVPVLSNTSLKLTKFDLEEEDITVLFFKGTANDVINFLYTLKYQADIAKVSKPFRG